MDIKYDTIYDSGTADFCFSIRKQKYIEIDGERQDIGLPERTAVCPGNFDEVERFAPELLPIMRTFWTPEIITAWEEKHPSILQGEQE